MVWTPIGNIRFHLPLVLLVREDLKSQANGRNAVNYPAFWALPHLSPALLSCHYLSGSPVNWNCSHAPNMLWALILYLRTFAHSLSLAEISLTILANRKIFCILFGAGFRVHLLREIFLVFFLPFGSKLDLSSALCDSLYQRMFQMMNLLISVCLLHDMRAPWARNYFLGI